MNPHPQRQSPARGIRRGYAVAGVVLALMWLGEGNEPAWAHAVRAGFLLLLIPPLLLRTNRRLTAAFHESAHPGRALARLITARILIVSAALVASALLGHLMDPRAAHDARTLGIRVLCVLLTIPLQIRAAHRARAGGVHPADRPTLSAPRVICAKLGLLAAALLAQMLIDPYVANAQVLTAVAIAVSVTVLGPRIHSRLVMTPAPQAAGQPSAARATG
ncbi:hypothetical protein [Streptomyces chattanoogensis]|uniref:hypothetical protein n=1 Tax=Streptomyces chattanoogensis TaxID=66876 RepID=UPI0036B2AA20